MKWSAGLSFLTSLRDRDASREADDDPADMGTAFGLDASFGPVEAEPTPGGATEPPPWEARLIRRSGL